MIFHLIRAALVACAVAALPIAAMAQSAPTPAGGTAKKTNDPVVATVNGDAIHLSDVEAARENLPAQYQSFPLEVVFPPLVERLIDGRLLLIEGRKKGLAKDPEVKERMARIEDQVIQTVYLTRAVKARLTDDVLKKRYDELVKANPSELEVHARHILVKTEDEAKDAIKELKGGADFAELAKKRSSGPSAPKGGDLGFVKKGEVVKEFADAAFALKDGQYTETPVKTEFGWHVIKVDERRMSQPPSFAEAKDQLTRDASQETVTAIVGDLREHAKIARFNPDGTPKTESGSGKPGTGEKKKK